jgi:hypothetical protein
MTNNHPLTLTEIDQRDNYTYKFIKFVRKLFDMDTKLTLSLNKDIIEAAKKYAKRHNTSLSNLIENYLVSVTNSSSNSKEEISPLVKSLSGVLQIDKKQDHKKQYVDFLTKKYK